jgi:uncharacterized protein (DUF302 family)
MTPTDPTYGYTTHLPGVSFADARTRITDALKAQGFGVLTEIDIAATMKAKLDKDFRQYVILGACNPNLAFKALSAELGIGLMLPCNVCVSIVKPSAMFQVVQADALDEVMREADDRLQKALAAVQA